MRTVRDMPSSYTTIESLVGIVLSVFSIMLTILQLGGVEWYLLPLLITIIFVYLSGIFVRPVGQFFRRHSLAVMAVFIVLLASIIPFTRLVEAKISPFKMIKSVKYEEQLYEEQGLSNDDSLLSSSYFFNAIYRNAAYMQKNLDSMPLLLPFNLSIETESEIPFSKYLDMMTILKNSTEYIYLFKYDGRYYAMKAENENQHVSFSFRSKQCCVYLRYDFGGFLKQRLDRGEIIQKIDYKDSLLAVVYKSKGYNRRFRHGGLVDYINNKWVGNLADLQSNLRSLRLDAIIPQPR